MLWINFVTICLLTGFGTAVPIVGVSSTVTVTTMANAASEATPTNPAKPKSVEPINNGDSIIPEYAGRPTAISRIQEAATKSVIFANVPKIDKPTSNPGVAHTTVSDTNKNGIKNDISSPASGKTNDGTGRPIGIPTIQETTTKSEHLAHGPKTDENTPEPTLEPTTTSNTKTNGFKDSTTTPVPGKANGDARPPRISTIKETATEITHELKTVEHSPNPAVVPTTTPNLNTSGIKYSTTTLSPKKTNGGASRLPRTSKIQETTTETARLTHTPKRDENPPKPAVASTTTSLYTNGIKDTTTRPAPGKTNGSEEGGNFVFTEGNENYCPDEALEGNR